MRVRFVLLAVLMLSLLAPSLPAQVTSADLSKDLAKFFAAYFEERLRDEPEFATTVGRHEYDDRWARLIASTTGSGRFKSSHPIPPSP